jgi:hypothetical protein
MPLISNMFVKIGSVKSLSLLKSLRQIFKYILYSSSDFDLIRYTMYSQKFTEWLWLPHKQRGEAILYFVDIKEYISLLSIFIFRFEWNTTREISTYFCLAFVSFTNSVLRRPQLSFEYYCNYVYTDMCTVKPYGILKVKNALVKLVYSVTAYTICRLFIFAADLLQDYYSSFLLAVIKTLIGSSWRYICPSFLRST